MGGDHKCPVCQATFTRPQHVARHMRSHTGDRPYKCQYCGDQFARSDLLSRHVNKCHSNEKPLPNTGARRKGSASASRATTSKQACDQCVQLSLPCDGCNPCSKCLNRKCRCTFVKFHRQTAPAGPGHTSRPPGESSSSSASALLSSTAALDEDIPMLSSSSSALVQGSLSASSALGLPPRGGESADEYDDDLFLGPPPPSASSSVAQPRMQTMAESLYHSNSFAFPPLYPSSASSSGAGAGAAGPSSGAVNVAVPVGPAELEAYAEKYQRAQAELFGPGRPGGAGGSGLTPGGIYDPRGVWLGGWETTGSGDEYGPPPTQSQHQNPLPHQQAQSHQQDQQDQQGQQQQLQRLRQQHHQMQQQQQQLRQMQQQAQQQQAQQQGQPRMPSRGEGPSMHVNDTAHQPPLNASATTMDMPLSYPSMQLPGTSGPPMSIAPSTSTTSTASSQGLAPSSTMYTAGMYGLGVTVPRSQSRPGTASSGGSDLRRRGSVESLQGYEAFGGAGGIHHAPQHHPHAQAGHPYHPPPEGFHNPHPHPHDFGHEGFDSGGDGRGGQGSGRGSAGSSNAHLPWMERGYEDEHAAFRLGNIPDRHSTASTTSSSSSHGHRNYDDGPAADTYIAQTDDRQADVHSAFGLMSLDDPNVIAGIAVDGQPFFSDPAAAHNQGLPMSTPMPMKRPHSGLLHIPPALDPGGGTGANTSSMASSLAREADSRELREVWKQYMRTPLSGPALEFGGPNLSPSKAGGQLGGGGGNGSNGRRPRVASLPSSKTPVVERDHLYTHMPGGPSQPHAQDAAGGKAGTTSSMRTTLHGTQEDLRSYEAAVLARNPPTHLNLQVRRPRGGGTGPAARPVSAHATGTSIPYSSSTSALVNAFGTNAQQMGSAPPGRVSFVDIKKKDASVSPAPLSSRASSVSAEGAGLSSDAESSRPSFKRLPSQTLGPTNSKRTFLGFGDNDERVAGWSTNMDKNNNVSSGVAPDPQTNVSVGNPKSYPTAGLAISHTDRVVASLAERRRRRVSAPSMGYMSLEGLQNRYDQDQNHQLGPQEEKPSEHGQGNVDKSYNDSFPSVGYAPGAP